MHDALLNSSCIGFTGTPIEADFEEITEAEEGRKQHLRTKWASLEVMVGSPFTQAAHRPACEFTLS